MTSKRDLVRLRAGGRCEYCHLPEALSGSAFHVEHIIPRAGGGTGRESNFALSCPRCNMRKGERMRDRDPASGRGVDLFHPRLHLWRNHFRWSRDQLRIEGRTAVGRATVQALDLNSLARQHLRLIWRDRLSDLFPFI